MRSYIMGIVAGLGLAGSIVGILGDRAYLIPGVILIAEALIAEAVYAGESRK